MTTCVPLEIINKLLFLSTAMHTSPQPLINSLTRHTHSTSEQDENLIENDAKSESLDELL